MPRRRRSGDGGIGLALAGGGPAGAIYEIGALWALDEALEGVDLNDLACYVGVSAGSLLASCLANGLSPSLLVGVISGDAPDEEPFDPDTFFVPNYREFARRGVMLPRLLMQTLWQLTRRHRTGNVTASLSRAARALPVALFDNEPIRRYLAKVFSRPGRTDDFRELRSQLVVVAADLASGRPIRFGAPGNTGVPISRAVQASTALPGIYPPVLIEGRHCVDGVLLKTLHASVALDFGVELLLCVNPIVPVDTRPGEESGALPVGVLLDEGIPGVLSQTFRTLVHSRLEVGLARYAERYPDADVVLFEPGRDEYDMFFSNVFSFSSRRAIAELAYAATRRDLLRRADELEPVLARHGIRIRREVLARDEHDIWGTATDHRVVTSEATAGASRKGDRGADAPRGAR